MKFSTFGQKFSAPSGIQVLMDDLGHALATNSDMVMLGGGNPAHIPELEALFQTRLQHILSDTAQFRKLVGIYDPPQGDMEFIRALAAMLNRTLGWSVNPENICLTNGSQVAFFMLFNLFAGQFPDGRHKQIKFPLTPEYIGYADAGLSENLFSAEKPSIELIGSHRFKYHVDFKALRLDETVGAVCVSRPTNPTGNVLSDQELAHLAALCKQHDIPLIVDGAYGSPFPSLIYADAQPLWDDGIILCLSLSKFGLPAARTGIVIAQPELIQALSRINAIINLATGSFGSMLALDLVQSDALVSLSTQLVRPFYQSKALKAQAILDRELKGLPYRLHQVEGAMFLWLWLEGLPVSSEVLYQRLKARGVLVVSGHHFFPGLSSEVRAQWRHTQECIRITYAQDDLKVETGLLIIADELKTIYRSAGCKSGG